MCVEYMNRIIIKKIVFVNSIVNVKVINCKKNKTNI